MNLYAYVSNDPVNRRDPLGLQDDEEVIVNGKPRRRVVWGPPAPMGFDAFMAAWQAKGWSHECISRPENCQPLPEDADGAKQSNSGHPEVRAALDRCDLVAMQHMPHGLFEMRRFSVERGVSFEAFRIVGPLFEMDRRLTPVIANYRYEIFLVTATGRPRTIVGGLGANAIAGGRQFEPTGLAWIESLTIRARPNQQSGFVRICAE